MHPLCVDQGVGVIPWSPLARGKLTRPWGETSDRADKDDVGARLFRQAEDTDRKIVQAVADIATRREVSPAQIALAWVRQKAAVTSPIIGATKMHHLDDAVASLDINLDDSEMRSLEGFDAPHTPEGF